MKRKFLIPFIVVPMLFSCAKNDAYVTPGEDEEVSYSAVLSEESVSLNVGDSKTITASATDGNTYPVKWYLSRNDVVSLTSSGATATVFATAAGEVTLSAQVGVKLANCKITVGGGGGGSGSVTSITLSETTKTINYVEGGQNSFQLNATVQKTGSVDSTITWSSNNTAVATVSKTGETSATVTGLDGGVAIITASCGGQTATCTVTVVKEAPGELSVRLNKNNLSLYVGDSETLVATTGGDPDTVTWNSSNTDAVSVSNTGVVTANAVGSSNVTVTVSKTGFESKTAQCVVTVSEKGSQPDYSSWSKAGHLYLHYLRPDNDYVKWAVWIWQKMPNDIDGSLWGAAQTPASIHSSMSDHWMTVGETGGVGTSTFCDSNGQVVDIDMTNTNIIGGKTGEVSPLIDNWEELDKARLGFLIVDLTQMGGGTHWTSDGSADTWIKKLHTLFPQGRNSYLHIFCISGAVGQYTTEGGQSITPNPTVDDKTGDYRSKIDITDLKHDDYTSGVRTSESFLDNRPGTGYQIFVPSFADGDGDGMGDLRGIINKLDYLEDLGIDVLWLTPIQESDSYHGYDVTDYYKIDSKFGTMEDYQELIYKAHKKGMKVLMDMVINHTSKNNVLFTKSERADIGQDKDGNPINYRDMYLWKYKGDKVREWNGVEKPTDWSDTHPTEEWKATFNEVNVEETADWYKDGTSDYYYFGKFGSGMAELNYSCKATRDYMTDMCKYWLSFGLDGFRLDAIKHIYLCSEIDKATAESAKYKDDYVVYDVSYRRYYDDQIGDYVTAKNDYSYDRDLNVIFWKQFAGTIKSAYPNCFLVGENFDGWNARIAPFYEAMDSQFDFSTYYHLNESALDAYGGIGSMGGDIKATLEYNKAHRLQSINGAFTSNHDVFRLLNHAGAEGDKSHNSEIITSHTPSEDSGQRAAGVHYVSASTAIERAKWFAAVTILTPGVSWMYYGDELGMSSNLHDKSVEDHGNNTDRWYRQPMKWGNTQKQDMVTKYTFSGLTVGWDYYNDELANAAAQQADSNSMYNWFKALCHVKQDNRYPTYGYIENQWGDVNMLSLRISDGTRTVIAVINKGNSVYNIEPQNQGEFIGGSQGASNTVCPAHGFCVVAK